MLFSQEGKHDPSMPKPRATPSVSKPTATPSVVKPAATPSVAKPAADKVAPVITVQGLSGQYAIGDKITYSINIKDDIMLESVTFSLKKGNMNEKWDPDKKTFKKNGKISTTKLEQGTYVYIVQAIDTSGNQVNYKGEFKLTQSTGTLMLTTDREANYYVDSAYQDRLKKGKHRLTIPVGTHTITLEAPGYHSIKKKIQILKSKTSEQYFLFPEAGYLTIEGPINSPVIIGKKEWGPCCPVDLELPIGIVEVTINKKTKSVTVVEGKRSFLKF